MIPSTATPSSAARPDRSVERAGRLARRHHWPPTAGIIAAWRNFILRDHAIGRTYALQLIDHVDAHGERLVITTPKEPVGRKELAMLAAIRLRRAAEYEKKNASF